MVNHSVSKLRCWQEVLTEAGSSGDEGFFSEYAVFCTDVFLAGYMGTKRKSEGSSDSSSIILFLFLLILEGHFRSAFPFLVKEENRIANFNKLN